MSTNAHHALLLTLLLAIIQITGCATAPASAEKPVRSEADPWEPMNRGIYRVNTVFDNATLKPIAKGYKKVLPTPVRRGINNFSVNLFTPRSAVNNFLQGKFGRGFDDIARFLFNSTIGIGGIFDVASAGGLERYNENFSQTMAVWGIPEGPYLVLPILGPQSLLDAVMLPLDILADPLMHYDNSSVRDKVYLLRTIDFRASLLTAEKFLEDSKDPYTTLRESYLQNRQFKIYDGDPPIDEELYDDFFDEE
jgi:phospholipid-binding lipoprotein MlaA